MLAPHGHHYSHHGDEHHADLHDYEADFHRGPHYEVVGHPHHAEVVHEPSHFEVLSEAHDTHH